MFSDAAPFAARAGFEDAAEELVLVVVPTRKEESRTLARLAIHPAEIEAEAVARPDTMVNPVDLGTILVPNGWLLLGPEQAGVVDVAAISRLREIPGARLRVWFESDPKRESTADIMLRKGRRADRHLRLPESPPSVDRDTAREPRR